MNGRNIFVVLFLNLFVFPVFSVSAGNNESRTDSIKAALAYQMKKYPVSQYRDVYKNFMQDFYGPGHMINDKVGACSYLQKELNSVEDFDGPDYEPTGFKGNFYRVNLRLINSGVIPYKTYLDTFVESVQSIVPPQPEVWMKTWNEIDEVILAMGLTFENEESDRKALAEQFKEGNFIVHHSDVYNENVNFHYRIISKENFEKVILPRIKAAISNGK